MICRMCLLDSSEYINIFEIEGMELNVAQIVAKHFWFEPKCDDPISNLVCNACWWKIDSFHLYYKSIEEAHRKLSERFSVKDESASVCLSQNEEKIKDEENVAVEFQIIDEVDIEDSNEDMEQDGEVSADVLSLQSEEVEYINLVPIDVGDNSEIEDVLEKPLIIEKSDAKDKKLRKNHNYTTESETTCHSKNEKTKDIEENFDNKLITFEKRKKRGRPKRLSCENDVKQTKISLQENNLSKTEKESEYLKKSKEDDEKIAKYMKLKCELCEAEYRTFAELKKHYRIVHKTKGYILCCNKILYKRVLILDHINKHLNPDHFKCHICNKIFADKQCLKNHMMRHESEDLKLFKCDKCPRRYTKQYMLDNHKLIHIPQEEREFFCNECGKAFPTNNLLQTHIRYVHKNAYGKMCHICAKVIRGKTMFEKHQLEHAGIVEPKVQCLTCGAWLKHEYSLKKHMARHTEERLSHVCGECGKVSPSKGALRSHIQYVHASKRTHQCSICDKAFKKPINLKEHMTTHTGEVLYTCPHCPKTFNSSANMHSHRKKVHRKEWEESRRKRGLPHTSSESNETEDYTPIVINCELIKVTDEDSSMYKKQDNSHNNSILEK